MRGLHPSNTEALHSALPHWQEAFGLATVVLGDRAAAEDVCQEALLRLAAMKRVVEEPGRVRPLFLRIVRNLAVSEGRRRRPDSLDARTEQAGPVEDSAAPDPAEETHRAERARAVRAALEELNPVWRSVLYLRDGLGLTYAEIGEVVERSVDVVRVTLHRARRRIRSQLDGRWDEEYTT